MSAEDALEITIPGMKRGAAKDIAGNNQLEALLLEHWERVFAVTYRIVGDWYEAEDLALETFWRLHQNPPPDEGYLAGWLYRVATNLGLNALRARRRRRDYEMRAGKWMLDTPDGDDPATHAEHNLEKAQVRLVLAEMKPKQAQILLLRHSGLSYAEIAAALEVSPSSVGVLLARADADFERRYKRLERRAL